MRFFKLVSILFLGFINIAHSEYLSIQQLHNINQDIIEGIKISTNAVNNGDVDTACNEAKRVLRLFYTINPEKDIPPEFLYHFKISQGGILFLAKSMKGVC
jgi:hypothetical protein